MPPMATAQTLRLGGEQGYSAPSGHIDDGGQAMFGKPLQRPFSVSPAAPSIRLRSAQTHQELRRLLDGLAPAAEAIAALASLRVTWITE